MITPLKKTDEILDAALAVPAEGREAFVESACRGDAALLAEVRAELEALKAEK